MRESSRHRLSIGGMVAAGVAVAALAGGAVGAGHLITSSAQIRDGAVTGADVRDASLTGRDIRNGSLSPADLSAAARGVRGRRGPVGATGATGTQGPAGPQGSAGAQGPAGPAGTEGPAGAPGPTGAAGPPGPTAFAGYTQFTSGAGGSGAILLPEDPAPQALILTLALPAGWADDGQGGWREGATGVVATASVLFDNDTASTVHPGCTVLSDAGGFGDGHLQVDTDAELAALTFQAASPTGGAPPTEVRLECSVGTDHEPVPSVEVRVLKATLSVVPRAF